MSCPATKLGHVGWLSLPAVLVLYLPVVLAVVVVERLVGIQVVMKGSTVYLSLFLAFVCRTLLLLRLSSLYVLVPLCLQHLRRIHHDSPVDVHFPSQVPLKDLGTSFGRCLSVGTMYITVSPNSNRAALCVRPHRA